MRKLEIFSYILIIFSLFCGTHQTEKDATIKIWYQWTFVHFQYPNGQTQAEAVKKHLYKRENVAIIDADYYSLDEKSPKRVFITTPQLKDGIPFTISEVTTELDARGEHLLRPFPSFDESAGSSSDPSTCEFAKSVFRVHIDKCGLLWVLDSGRVNVFVNSTKVCPPKLLIYDLKNHDKLLLRYEFPDGIVIEGSLPITLVTESYKSDCTDSIAYIADCSAHGLIVFDLKKRSSSRVKHNYFWPTQTSGTATVAGTTFDLMDGVFGLALGPGDANTRKLYFHSYASFRESYALVSVLKNTTITQNPDKIRDKIKISVEARSGQSTVEVMTKGGILLFADIPGLSVKCWNSNTPFVKENLHVVYQSYENLQFINGMKLKNDKELTITSSKLQNYAIGHSNGPDVKYRVIFIDDVHKLLKGSPCLKS
ncbi:protein yellow-like [Planococcus citri]|uniref:protein yellow-like n=1 Tax=Planococcus citri TaxID=170843 RepID=UPI0031F7C2BF